MPASLYDSSLPKVNPKNTGVIPHMTSSRLFAVSFCPGSICWLVLTLRLLSRGLRGAEDNGMSVLRTRVAKPSVVVDSKLDQRLLWWRNSLISRLQKSSEYKAYIVPLPSP